MNIFKRTIGWLRSLFKSKKKEDVDMAFGLHVFDENAAITFNSERGGVVIQGTYAVPSSVTTGSYTPPRTANGRLFVLPRFIVIGIYTPMVWADGDVIRWTFHIDYLPPPNNNRTQLEIDYGWY